MSIEALIRVNAHVSRYSDACQKFELPSLSLPCTMSPNGLLQSSSTASGLRLFQPRAETQTSGGSIGTLTNESESAETQVNPASIPPQRLMSTNTFAHIEEIPAIASSRQQDEQLRSCESLFHEQFDAYGIEDFMLRFEADRVLA